MLDLQSFKGFTPGPWKMAANGKNGNTVRIWRNDPGENETNTGYACIAPHVHGVINANLIAAAPDLLALAIKQEAEIKRLREALEEIRTSHIGDIPASSQHDEHSWAYKRFGDLRRIANQALEPSHA